MYIFLHHYLINVVESHGIIFLLYPHYTRALRLKRKFIWWYIVRTNATDLTNEDFDKKTNMILIIYFL
jgi:hypothetical protein